MLHPAKQNRSRLSSYPSYKQVLKTKGLTKPMSLNQIEKFEKINNVSVNVFMLEYRKKSQKFNVVPVSLTKNKIENRHANFLMIQSRYDAVDEEDNLVKEMTKHIVNP